MIRDLDGILKVDFSSPTGLRWLVNASTRARAGDPAGSDFELRYWRIRFKGRDDLVHRVIWRMAYGDIPDGLEIDHIDGNGKNNRLENLRAVRREVNQRNRKQSLLNVSGRTGVRISSRANGYEAIWTDADGRQRTRFFAVEKYGRTKAFDLAVDARDEAIKRMNTNGAGYTKTHGKRRLAA